MSSFERMLAATVAGLCDSSDAEEASYADAHCVSHSEKASSLRAAVSAEEGGHKERKQELWRKQVEEE